MALGCLAVHRPTLVKTGGVANDVIELYHAQVNSSSVTTKQPSWLNVILAEPAPTKAIGVII